MVCPWARDSHDSDTWQKLIFALLKSDICDKCKVRDVMGMVMKQLMMGLDLTPFHDASLSES